MTGPTIERVAVTQADREAAAELAVRDGHRLFAADIRAGKDDSGAYVQAFARHRISTSSGIEEIVGALEEVSRLVADAFKGRVNAPLALDAIDDVVKAALARIRGSEKDGE